MANVEQFKKGIPQDFVDATQQPKDAGQRRDWQVSNRRWWEANPMRYDFGDEPVDAAEGTHEFYECVDRRFFRTARESYPWRQVPFDGLIPYESLSDQGVLEIGVGCGSHAQLLATRAAKYVGIDLTEFATRMTARRLALAGLPGAIVRMDGERLALPDSSFDFVWSWGVIHHSSDTRKVLEEVHRVLRPTGRFIAMVYHRSFWTKTIRAGFYYGVIRGGFLRVRSSDRLLQESTDGAIARYYTVKEWHDLVSDLFDVNSIRVLGHKTQLIPLPSGRVKTMLGSLIPDRVGRLLTNRPSVGYLLVADMKKR